MNLFDFLKTENKKTESVKNASSTEQELNNLGVSASNRLTLERLKEGIEAYKRYNGQGFHISREESQEKYNLYCIVKEDKELVKELDKEILEELFADFWKPDGFVWGRVKKIIDILFLGNSDYEYWGGKLLDEIEKMDTLNHKQRILIIERMVGDDQEHENGGIALICKHTNLEKRMVEVMDKLMDFFCDEDEDYGFGWHDVIERHHNAIYNYRRTYGKFRSRA